MSRQIFGNSNGMPNDKLSDAFSASACFGIFELQLLPLLYTFSKIFQAIKLKLPRSVVLNQYIYWTWQWELELLNAGQWLYLCTDHTNDTSWHHASALYSIWSYANDEQFKPFPTGKHYRLINACQCVGCQPKIKAEWIYAYSNGMNPSNELFNEFIDNLNFFKIGITWPFTQWKLSMPSHLLVHSEGTDPWKVLTDLIEAEVFSI